VNESFSLCVLLLLVVKRLASGAHLGTEWASVALPELHRLVWSVCFADRWQYVLAVRVFLECYRLVGRCRALKLDLVVLQLFCLDLRELSLLLKLSGHLLQDFVFVLIQLGQVLNMLIRVSELLLEVDNLLALVVHDHELRVDVLHGHVGDHGRS